MIDGIQIHSHKKHKHLKLHQHTHQQHKPKFEGRKVQELRRKYGYFSRLCKSGITHAEVLCHKSGITSKKKCLQKLQKKWCKQKKHLKKEIEHATLTYECFHKTPPNKHACHKLQNKAIHFEAKHFADMVARNDTKACKREIHHPSKYICDGDTVCTGLLMKTCLESRVHDRLHKTEVLCLPTCEKKPTHAQKIVCITKLQGKCGHLPEVGGQKCLHDCKHAHNCAIWRPLAKRFCKYHLQKHTCMLTVEQRLCAESGVGEENEDNRNALHNCVMSQNITSCSFIKKKVLAEIANEQYHRFTLEQALRILKSKVNDYDRMCKSDAFMKYLCEYAGSEFHNCIAEQTGRVCNHYRMLKNDLDGLTLENQCHYGGTINSCDEFRHWRTKSKTHSTKHLRKLKKIVIKTQHVCKKAQEKAGKACSQAKRRTTCERNYIHHGCHNFVVAQTSYKMHELHHDCHFNGNHASCMEYSQFKFTNSLHTESHDAIKLRSICRHRQALAKQQCLMEENQKLCIERLTRDVCVHATLDVDALRPRYIAFQCEHQQKPKLKEKYCRESHMLKKYFLQVNEHSLLAETEPLLKFQGKACANAVAEGGLLCKQTSHWHKCVKKYKKRVCTKFDNTVKNQTMHVLDARCQYLHSTEACECVNHPENTDCVQLIQGVQAFYHHHWTPPMSPQHRKTECDETLAHRVALSMCNNLNGINATQCYQSHHDEVCIAAQLPIAEEENQTYDEDEQTHVHDSTYEIPLTEAADSIVSSVLKIPVDTTTTSKTHHHQHNSNHHHHNHHNHHHQQHQQHHHHTIKHQHSVSKQEISKVTS